MKKNELRKLFFKSLLLFVVTLSFASCSNLFGGGDSGSSSSESKPAEAQNQPKTFTVTGDIKITEELKDSGAIPEEYSSLFSSINNSQERTAFPAIPTTGYYVTATDGDNTVTLDSNLITTTANGASFSMTLSTDNPDKVWTVEAGIKAAFNGSEVVILKDTYEVTTPPTFYHEFVIKPLASGNGNVDLTINYETANTADELELYFGDTKITVDTSNGETLSTTQITLKNREAGAHKAKLVFKKNGYVVYTDYQGINIFPNMTTNTWVSSGGNGPVTGSTYKLTDTLVQDYLLTQIYVGSTTVSGTTFTANDTTGNGTVFAPFATFAKAIDYLRKNGNTGKNYTIWISGEITGAQTISDGTSTTTPILAKSLTISGVTGNTNDKLIGGEIGSVLYLDTDVLVKFSNLTITGGKGTSLTADGKTYLYGGGIFIHKGSVELTTGAVVNGNTANIGGGICLYNGNLYINDSAVIGKPDANVCAENADGKYGNKATSKGGGIGILAGTLHIGYKPGTTTTEAETTGGIIYNLAANSTETHGGGIDNDKGTINFAHGYVQYNYACGVGTGNDDDEYVGCGGGISTAYKLNMSGDAKISNNKSAYGGAVYITNDTDSYLGNFQMSGGSITSNYAEKQHEQYGIGGGVAIGAKGTFTMSDGTLSSNMADINGGAIYHGGTFNISSAAYISSDNDVYLVSGKYVMLGTPALSKHSDSDQISISLATWKRGTAFLGGTNVSGNVGKFKGSETDWKSIFHENLGKLYTGYEIYVSGTTDRADGIGEPKTNTEGGRGTKEKPYSTIKEAVEQCWNSDQTFTIYLSGTITGVAQSIPAANSTSKTGLAKSITIEGVTGNNKDIINRNLTAAPETGTGTALTINTTTSVIIKKIKITGGFSKTNGGGILVNALKSPKLTLGEGALISGNSATNSGGGIYFRGQENNTGTFTMNSSAQIKGNTATDSSTGKGGGVYLMYANLCMYGNALIGEILQGTQTIATTSAGQHSNYAKKDGGGVYIGIGSTLWLGYSEPADNKKSALTDGYGIRYNATADYGGGVYNNGGTLKMASGSILYNATAISGSGGGLYTVSAAVHLYGGQISQNKAKYGGGIYNGTNGKIFMTCTATVGGKSAGAASETTGNYATMAGAGIYNTTGAKLYLGYDSCNDDGTPGTATAETALSGGIRQNYAYFGSQKSDQGGGIYSVSLSTIYFNTGNISYNGASTAGGIYLDNTSTVVMTGGTIASNTSTKDGGGVYIDADSDDRFLMSGGSIESNTATAFGGAVCIASTSNKPLVLSGSASIPSNGTKHNNDIFLYNDTAIKINDANYAPGTTSKKIWISPSSYYGRKVIDGTDTILANAFKYFYVTKENTSDINPTWVVNKTGNIIGGVTVVTGSDAITPDKLTAGTDYTFVFPADMGNYALACAFQQLFGGAGYDDAPGISEIPAIGSGSVIDLSRLTITSFSTAPTFYSSDTKTQTISRVILPATLSAEAFENTAIHSCFRGVGGFEVDSSASNIKCYGGAVYNSDYTKLLCYPGGQQSFSLHSSCTEIGAYACCEYQNTSTEGITIPNAIKKIGKNAFNYSSIRKITFPTNANFTEIPENCCRVCVSLTTVTIPSNVTTISKEAFYRCVISSNITLPTNLQTIGEGAFKWAFSPSANLTLSIPSNVSRIGQNAFTENTSTNLIISLQNKNGWYYSDTEYGMGYSVDAALLTSDDFKSSGSTASKWLHRN